MLQNCSFRAIFRPQNIFYECGKQCSEQPDVFFSFSCIFGCELTVFSVNLDAEHWNLEFFGWTKNVVWVNPKNSRFQCEASRWTEKNVREQPKMQEKLKKTQVVAHCIVFRIHRNNFEDGKWLEWNFSGWTWAQLRCSQYHFLNERKLTYTNGPSWGLTSFMSQPGGQNNAKRSQIKPNPQCK